MNIIHLFKRKLLKAKKSPWKYTKYLKNKYKVTIGSDSELSLHVLIDLIRLYRIIIGNKVMIINS